MNDDITPDERKKLIEDTLFGPGPEFNLDGLTVETNVRDMVIDLITGCSAAVKKLTELTGSTDEGIALQACQTLLDVGFDVMTTAEAPDEC